MPPAPWEVACSAAWSRRVIALPALYRADDDAGPISNSGAVAVQGDLAKDSADQLAARMRGHDAVVFSAGAGGDGAKDVDRDGAKKVMDAAAAAGIHRFVLVSVFMDAWRGDESPGEGFERYMAAKRAVDDGLKSEANSRPVVFC